MATSQICQKMIIAVIGAHGLKTYLARSNISTAATCQLIKATPYL
jgi:hypothetical protein